MVFIPGASVPSEPVVALTIAVILFAVSRPIILRTAHAEKKPWLVGILTASLILHLLAAPMQIYIVDHIYHGVADWVRYDHQGAELAPAFRHFDFSFSQAPLRGIVGDASVSIAAGAVFAVISINQLGAFFIFGWLAFLGLVMFYRAFTLTFEGADHKRYAYLLFFLPSLIFWTADVSKEAIMSLSLGLIAYGAAKILARRRGGFVLAIIGVAIGAPIRPNELLLVMGGFAVALIILPPGPQRNLGGLRRLGGIAVLVALLGLSVFLTLHFLHGKGGSFSLQQISQNNKGNANAPTPGHGSSVVGYSSSPAAYPKDIYQVLFNPLPVTAHSTSELVASMENMVLVGIILASFRQLRILPRAAFARPYVMLCSIYSAGFIYTFAALGNLGLITRERTLLFPFLLVLFSIPRTPKGEPPRYEWELRRKARIERRRQAQGPGPPPARGPGRPGPPVPSRS